MGAYACLVIVFGFTISNADLAQVLKEKMEARLQQMGPLPLARSRSEAEWALAERKQLAYRLETRKLLHKLQAEDGNGVYDDGNGSEDDEDDIYDDESADEADDDNPCNGCRIPTLLGGVFGESESEATLYFDKPVFRFNSESVHEGEVRAAAFPASKLVTIETLHRRYAEKHFQTPLNAMGISTGELGWLTVEYTQ